MAAEHDDFVGLIGAGNFGDHVIRGLALGEALVEDVELQSDGFAIGEEAIDSAVVFIAEHDGGGGFGEIEGAVVEGADLAVLARRVVDAHEGFVGDQPFIDLLIDLRGGEFAGLGGVHAAAAAEAAASGVGIGGIELFLDGLVVAAQGRGGEVHRDDGGLADEDDFPFDLGFILLEASGEFFLGGGGGRRDFDGIRVNGALGGRGPGEDFEGEIIADGRGHVAGGVLVHPAGMAEIPGFEVGVFEAPFGELLDGPIRGGLVVRRASEAGAVAIGEHVEGVHHLRVFGGFLADFGVDGGIDRLLREGKADGG